jgi:hypothetical protein
VSNAYDRADLDVFFSDFAVEVESVTWGTGTFRGIFDRIEVEVSGAGGITTSRFRSTILTDAENVPDTAATGDQVRVDSTTYKVVDYQESEPGLVLLVLGRTS